MGRSQSLPFHGQVGEIMTKKVAIFYFSGTGNTWWISNTLANILRENGYEADAHSIEKLKLGEANQIIEDCNLVGFGYPIYGSDLPHIMKDFLNSLQKVDMKESFIFCTQHIWSGDGARAGIKYIKEKGFSVQWGEHFHMPNNICTTITGFYPYTNSKDKIILILSKTQNRVRRFVDRIINKQNFRRGFNPISRVLGAFQRVPFNLIHRRLNDEIGIDESSCFHCGKCALICPTQNLEFNGENFFSKARCILCLRCYNFCPVSAITFMNKKHNKKRGEPYRGPEPDFDPKVLIRERLKGE